MNTHRILIVTNRIPYPLNDGGALAMHVMIEGYYKAGWKVSLLSMNTSRHYVTIESLPELYRNIDFEGFDKNTDVKVVPTIKNFFLSKQPNHADRFYDTDFEKKLRKIIDDFEPEIIQIESIYLTTYIETIREISKAKIILRLHNIEHQIWEKLSHESSTFRRYYLKDLAARIKKFEIIAWQEADILMPITNTDAILARTLTENKKIVIAPFGIESEEPNNNSSNEKWIAYHIGAMDWMPNAEGIKWFLKDVWPSIHEDFPLFEFHFAGRSMPGSFEKYEQNCVICAGEVSSAQDFIKDKKILIVPINSGGGIRVKVLEAMSVEKVVISTSVGMQGIEAEDGIHFLLAENKEDFQKSIRWVLENKEEAIKMGTMAKKLVSEKYNQKKISTYLIGELNSFLEG